MILCLLQGHEYVNEVQTVAQLFFPGEKFGFGYGEESDAPVPWKLLTVIDNDAAYAVVYKDGIEIARYRDVYDDVTVTPRRGIMLALYHALQSVVPTYTPWGALTGIRPSKLVREWLEAGSYEENIIARLKNPYCCTESKANLALSVAKAEIRLAEKIEGIGLYVSIPFCPSRCLYCSFNMGMARDSKILTDYTDALVSEIFEKADAAKEMGVSVSSIYIGGGTPTVLPEECLEKVLAAIDEAFCLKNYPPVEYTVEAGRPDTCTQSKLELLRRYDVTRIAINPQTLNDHTLSLIGREHTAADFFNAFGLARQMGFGCISVDVIAGLPGEAPEDMRRTMEGIISLRPENITVHTLAIKRASKLNEYLTSVSQGIEGQDRYDNQQKSPTSEHYALPSVGTTEEELNLAAELCAKAGLLPYYLYRQKNMVGLLENVGYSLPGRECLYNIGMMAEVQTILGTGAGAVSKFVLGSKITREFNVKNPEIYINRRCPYN